MASRGGLRGKVALIVTQNSGPSLDVSVALAKSLLEAGCVVRMAGQTMDLEFAAMSRVNVRDDSKFAITELDSEVRPSAVASFVDDYWTSSRQPLHLVFLVALHHEERRVQNGDYEKSFAANCVSPLLFTHMLLPAMARSGSASVFAVVSDHYKGSALLDDPQFESQLFDPATAMGQSQTALLLYCADCERRFGERGIHFHGIDVGVVSGSPPADDGVPSTADKAAAAVLSVAAGKVPAPEAGALVGPRGAEEPAAHEELGTGREGVHAQEKFYAHMIRDLGYLPVDPIEATEEDADVFAMLACCGASRDDEDDE